MANKRKMEDIKKKESCKAKRNNDIQEQEQQQQVSEKTEPELLNPNSGSGEETEECFNNTPTESVADIQNLFQCSTPNSKNNQNPNLTQEQEISFIETSTKNGTKRKREDSLNNSTELTLKNEKLKRNKIPSYL